jgi:hypothetical protein
MNPLWFVGIVFLLIIGGAMAFSWILKTHANRLGAIFVPGNRTLRFVPLQATDDTHLES